MLGTHAKVGSAVIEVITSFNQHYYDLIGRDCVDSWLQHWGDDFRLTCYVEGFRLPFENGRIQQIDFDQLDPDYLKFQAEDRHDSIKRFAKKAYSVMHAMHHSTSKWVIWLDADVITQQDIGWTQWRPLLKKHYLATYMGVWYDTDKSGNVGRWLVPETGVFAMNRGHKNFAEFRDEYCRRYHERDNSGLRRFYDNDVLGAAINHVPQAEYHDICQEFVKEYKTPLRHTVLGPYLNHYKAKHSKAFYSQFTADQ